MWRSALSRLKGNAVNLLTVWSLTQHEKRRLWNLENSTFIDVEIHLVPPGIHVQEIRYTSLCCISVMDFLLFHDQSSSTLALTAAPSPSLLPALYLPMAYSSPSRLYYRMKHEHFAPVSLGKKSLLRQVLCPPSHKKYHFTSPDPTKLDL